MKHLAIFNYASRLREIGNAFILAELEKVGLRDIAPSHGDILSRLLTCDSCNMSELALHAHRTKSTVTALVNKLEKAGYVSRISDVDDARCIKVRLTEKGRSLKPTFDTISEGLQTIITDQISEEEALTLEKLLAACVESRASNKK